MFFLHNIKASIQLNIKYRQVHHGLTGFWCIYSKEVYQGYGPWLFKIQIKMGCIKWKIFPETLRQIWIIVFQFSSNLEDVTKPRRFTFKSVVEISTFLIFFIKLKLHLFCLLIIFYLLFFVVYLFTNLTVIQCLL